MIAIPRRVFVFSGHLVDEAGRATTRFPNDEETIARVQRDLDAALTASAAGRGDLALTQGACGGDLVFSTLCVERGLTLRWLQPLAEDRFIADSVARGGAPWLARYAALRAALDLPPLAMPAHLGRAVDDAVDPYRRCNHWLLDTARAYGIDKLHLIALWDGKRGEGDGGTADMIEDARCWTRQITVVRLQSP